MGGAPEDTALDMLSFALSGPGLGAGAAFIAAVAGFVVAFAEVGPRRDARAEVFHVLRARVSGGSMRVETAQGVRAVGEGETVLRLGRFEECTAVSKALEKEAARRGLSLEYAVYRAQGEGLAELFRFPREVNAPGGAWARDAVVEEEQGTLDARWEEYLRLGDGAADEVDKEWAAVMKRLSLIQFETEKDPRSSKDCKLCDGSGLQRCYKCGGAARGKNGGSFVCDCESGKRPCPWCSSSE